MKVDNKVLFSVVGLLVLGVVIWLIISLKNQEKEKKALAKQQNGGTNTNPSPGGSGGGTAPPPNNTGTNTNNTSATYIYKLADDFRAAFLGSAGSRCGEIRAVNRLTDSQLDDLSDYYWFNYGLTPFEEMRGAFVWCPFSLDGISLYDRLLKKHNASIA